KVARGATPGRGRGPEMAHEREDDRGPAGADGLLDDAGPRELQRRARRREARALRESRAGYGCFFNLDLVVRLDRHAAMVTPDPATSSPQTDALTPSLR